MQTGEFPSLFLTLLRCSEYYCIILYLWPNYIVPVSCVQVARSLHSGKLNLQYRLHACWDLYVPCYCFIYHVLQNANCLVILVCTDKCLFSFIFSEEIDKVSEQIIQLKEKNEEFSEHKMTCLKEIERLNLRFDLFINITLCI